MNNNKAYPQRDEHPYTQFLDFGWSQFGKPLIDINKGIIVVPVHEFKVYPGFPQYDKSVIVLDGDLIFEGVTLSIREIAEDWNEGESKYKKRYKIIDEEFPSPYDTPYEFYLGGASFDPKGWIEWYIDAVTVRIQERQSIIANHNSNQ